MTVTIDGEESGGFSEAADEDGNFSDAIRFEPHEAGTTVVITAAVPETECAAWVVVNVAGPG